MRSRVKRPDRGLTVARVLLLVGAVGLVGFLVYRQIDRLTGTRVPVWVTTAAMRAGETITATQLKMVQQRPPAGAIVNRADIIDRTLVRDKAEGAPIYATDLPPREEAETLAATVPAGRVLATVRVESMDLPVPQLRPGDRLEIMQATPEGVRLVAGDAYMMGTLMMKVPPGSNGDSGRILGVDISVPGANDNQPSGSALVLGILPQDVFALAAAEASGRKLKLILHADSEVQSGTLLSFRPPPPRAAVRPSPRPSVEVIAGNKRERVFVDAAPVGGAQ